MEEFSSVPESSKGSSKKSCSKGILELSRLPGIKKILQWNAKTKSYSRFHLVVHRRRSPYLKSFWSYEPNFLYVFYLDPVWLLDGVTFLPANFWGPTPCTELADLSGSFLCWRSPLSEDQRTRNGVLDNVFIRDKIQRVLRENDKEIMRIVQYKDKQRWNSQASLFVLQSRHLLGWFRGAGLGNAQLESVGYVLI